MANLEPEVQGLISMLQEISAQPDDDLSLEIDVGVFHKILDVIASRTMRYQGFDDWDVERWAQVLSNLSWAERERIRASNEEGDEDPIPPLVRMREGLSTAIEHLFEIERSWTMERKA